jgi:hypothetical protein
LESLGSPIRFVNALAFAKNVSVTTTIALDSPTFDGGPKVYKVNLRNGKGATTIPVDHDALTDSDEFFLTFVVPQLEAAIDKLRVE